MEMVDYFISNSKDLAIAIADFINFAAQCYLAANLPVIGSSVMVDFINFADQYYYLVAKLSAIENPTMVDLNNFVKHYYLAAN